MGVTWSLFLTRQLYLRATWQDLYSTKDTCHDRMGFCDQYMDTNIGLVVNTIGMTNGGHELGR